jgi:tRNA pseudouridine55 synthase
MDGIIVINKPQGWTSHDIVAKVKRIVGEKVGHTGTLDPMAEGVLPLLIGKGTQCSSYLVNHDKEYIATVQLGSKTDTGDKEGTITETKEIPDSLWQTEKVKQVLAQMQGETWQTPPMYSAIKVRRKKII